MPSRRISLSMEGPPSEDGHVRVDAFLREIQATISALGELDRQLSGHGRGTTYYRIVDLRHSSPATVVLEACPTGRGDDYSNEIMPRFFSSVRAVTENTEPERVGVPFLEDIKQMVFPIGRGLSSLSLSMNGARIVLGEDIGRRIDALLAPEEFYPGWLRGMLEYINIHEGKNVFRIYPDIGAVRVTCTFPQELANAAVSAIGRFVEVRGTVASKALARYPHAIAATEIEVMPTEDELPTLADLGGMAPDITGGLSSEEFVERVRNERQS